MPGTLATGMAADEEITFRLRDDDLVFRDFGDEAIILDLQSSTYLSANAAAAVLWGRLEHGATRTALVESLLARFEVDRGRAEADVDRFIEAWRRQGLITEAG
jgi:hypothetical protein